MKFRNYKNKHTNDNVIHSYENLMGMTFDEITDRANELGTQYKQIGLPTNSELNSSPNAVYVHAYTKDDGTQVRAHWRSKPEGGIIANQIQNGISIPSYNNGIFGDLNKETFPHFDSGIFGNVNNTNIPTFDNGGGVENNGVDVNNQNLQNTIAPILLPMILSQISMPNMQTQQNVPTGFASDIDLQQEDNLNENPLLLEGNISKGNFEEGLKDFLHKYVKPYRDYEGLNSIEKAQKFASKHVPWWTPGEYYGISEYLADNGKMPDKYKKNNEHYKLGDIADNRTREIITKKVINARQDCPVGPYINDPLDNVDVIVPKPDSELVQKVKRSEEIKKFIEDNRALLEAGEVVSGSIDFEKPQFDMKNNEDLKSFAYRKNEETGRFAAIHYADIVDARMNKDGTVTMKLVDYYDFNHLDEKKYNLFKIMQEIEKNGISKTAKNILNNSFNVINNRAYEQQKLGKLKPYAIYFEFTL